MSESPLLLAHSMHRERFICRKELKKEEKNQAQLSAGDGKLKAQPNFLPFSPSHLSLSVAMAPSLLASLSIFSGGILVGVTTTAYLSSPPPKPKQQLGEVTIVEPGSRGGGGGLAAILSEGGFRAAKSGEVWKFGNHPGQSVSFFHPSFESSYRERES